ncbi:MAG: DUF3267 domain-containing protein [Oscillospiraceae bacterium]|nr:DUF3267 domain-containing protein [Oscillospiraceae bacterium]
MKAYGSLPEGYLVIAEIDLQKNKKQMILVNGLALVIMVLLIAVGHGIVPIGTMFDMENGVGLYFLRFGALLAGTVVYMVLHELIHGAAMKSVGTKKVKYGFTGMYAFAGSEDWYDRSSYLYIALAPVVLWGIVLAVLQPAVPDSWFWVVYFIQVSNLSGAAGDLYVTWRCMKRPADILIKDAGTSMKVYSAE